MLEYESIDKNSFIVSLKGVFFGKLVMLEDGYYRYIPIDFKGTCLSSWILFDIANKLEELNLKQDIK